MECLNKILSKSRMRLGESFPLRFEIYTKADKATMTPSKTVVGQFTPGATNEILADKVAILVAGLRKTWDGMEQQVTTQVLYDLANRCWLFPISQKESLALAAGEYPGSIKVKFEGTTDTLISEIDPLIMIESIDKEEL